MIFIDKAIHDMAGFVLVLGLALFGVGLCYDNIFYRKINEATGELYRFSQTMSYVASNAVGGYVDLPGESGSSPI